ncbi:retrovirus-related pol polyprotein from transposon TNT 1-94 [Tanacetum coccineum]
MGEDSAMLTDPQHTPTFIQPSPPPQKTQKPRKPKRKDTQVPQPSGPTELVIGEDVHKELGDSLAKTINGEVQLHALVDGKKIIITESTIRRDLQLEDAKGVDSRAEDCLLSQDLSTILKQHQNEVNEIRAERLARTANPLALVAQQQPVYHHQNHPTQNTQYSSTRSQQSTRNRGKAIVTSSAPTYDPEPATVTEDEEMSKEKEIDKLMALISLSENVGTPVVQKSGIQCYNCKEYGHVSRECQKPKRVKDAAYHKEKMLLYLKKFQAELDKYNDVNYASKVEIDCAKAKGDLIFAKPEFLKKAQRANPRLYDIGCYNDNLALMLAPVLDENDSSIFPNTSVSRTTALRAILEEISGDYGQVWKCSNCTNFGMRSVQELIHLNHGYYGSKGLKHDLFSVGQFCDADLEVAFRKSTCYIRDLKGNDLLIDGENLDKMKEKLKTIHVNFDELPQMASDHVNSDPGPQCSTTVLKQDSLSPSPQSQENVPQVVETVTTSNELELLYSLMFSELLNGNSPVVSKSSIVHVADNPDKRQQT